MTLAGRLSQTGGRPSGFDYLRISLALGIFFEHAFLTVYGDALTAPLPVISLVR